MSLLFRPGDVEPRSFARLFASVVVPRPIGWASTLSRDGVPNLAPFSYFNAVENTPPMVMLSIGRRSGQSKDTLRNIQETGEFVINIADAALADAVTLTSGEYGPEIDEAALAQLELLPSAQVRPPRVATAPAALEVTLSQIVPVTALGYTIVIGQVISIHVRAGLLRPNGLVDAALMQPLARLGGDEFATLGQVFARTRPDAGATEGAQAEGAIGGQR